jgi:dTDP-glucose pyrophosphorylase
MIHDPGIFDMNKRIRSSAGGELATSSADSGYRKQNIRTYGIIDGEWADGGTFESLQHAKNPSFSIDSTVQPGEYHAHTL